jgi:hypothetical protein
LRHRWRQGCLRGEVDFDGGVREPAPSSGNPESDHNELLLNLLQEHRGGNTVDFWPMAGPAKSPPAADPGEDSDQGEDWRKGGT